MNISTMKACRSCWPRLVLGAVLLLFYSNARAQQAWRPFRPGLIYSYATAGTSNSTPNTYLLRLDSAYRTTAGDSVWAFNRLLRAMDGGTPGIFTTARKSRNNLFGARLVWTPGTSEYTLENVAEGTYQAALSLRLRPRAVVGSTWAASTSPALTATLTSRTWQSVTAAGSPFDSVATITLSSGAVLRLSKQYGLLAGPRWLTVTGAAAPQWQANSLPAALAGTVLSPLRLFDLRPGDQLGYNTTSWSIGSPPCSSDYTLRLIQTRQLTADSLIYTYRQQTRTVISNYIGCYSAPGTTIGPVQSGRLAFSLRTGCSPQYPALALLSGEYRALPTRPQSATGVFTGLGLQLSNNSTGCLVGNAAPAFQQVYSSNGVTYSFPTDGGWLQSFVASVGETRTYDTNLVYYAIITPGGIVTCGTPTNFAGLLPTRTAQAAALATLHPNPAAEAATLTLAQPTRAGQSLHLTDALGRTVWQVPVAAGQTSLTVPLAGQPAGLYLLRLSGEGNATTWKLTHE